MRAAFNVAQANASMWMLAAILWLCSESMPVRAEAFFLSVALCAANVLAAVWAARKER